MAKANNTAAAKLRRMQNQAMALELRRAGQDYRDIAHKLGCSKSAAHKWVSMALAESKAALEADVSELKAEELNRLDALLGKLWVKADQYQAVDRILAVMQRKAKLLGLDAPVKLAHAGPDGGPIPVRNDGIDLSQLSEAELEQYEALVASAAQRRAGAAGVGAPPA